MKTRKFPDTAFNISNTILMVIMFIIMLYPFIYVLCYSLSEPLRLKGGLLIFPEGLNISSYILCFKYPDIVSSIFISVARTAIGPVMMLFITSMAAYVITKNDFVGVRFFRKFFVFTMYFSGGLIPTYLLIKSMHLTNNFLVYILPGLISAFSLILIKTYIESLPKELEESAFVDGANEMVIFFRIILPNCIPIVAAIILFGAINHWNSLMDNLLYNSMNRKLYTLQYVLFNLFNTQTQSIEQAKTQFGYNVVNAETLKMSLTVISIIPILIIYPFVQRYFTSGLMVGAVKG